MKTYPKLKKGTVAFFYDGLNEENFLTAIREYGYYKKDTKDEVYLTIESDAYQHDMLPNEYLIVYPDCSSDIVTVNEYLFRYEST